MMLADGGYAGVARHCGTHQFPPHHFQWWKQGVQANYKLLITFIFLTERTMSSITRTWVSRRCERQNPSQSFLLTCRLTKSTWPSSPSRPHVPPVGIPMAARPLDERQGVWRPLVANAARETQRKGLGGEIGGERLAFGGFIIDTYGCFQK